MERKGNSNTGKASMIISIIGIFLYALYYLLSFSANKIDPYNVTDEGYLLDFFPAGIYIFLFFLSLTSIGLGVAGIFQKTRVRKSAFIGTSISSAILSSYLIGIIVFIFQNIS